MSLLLFCSRAVNSSFNLYNRSAKFAADIFRLWSTEDSWLINDDGVFVNASRFGVSSDKTLWIYSENRLYKKENTTLKKLPILSCVFSYDGNEVCIDDFLEDLRTEIGVPLPVLMAAFTINQNRLYPWSTAAFEAYMRNGDSVKFNGDVKHIPGLT